MSFFKDLWGVLKKRLYFKYYIKCFNIINCYCILKSYNIFFWIRRYFFGRLWSYYVLIFLKYYSILFFLSVIFCYFWFNFCTVYKILLYFCIFSSDYFIDITEFSVMKINYINYETFIFNNIYKEAKEMQHFFYQVVNTHDIKLLNILLNNYVSLFFNILAYYDISTFLKTIYWIYNLWVKYLLKIFFITVWERFKITAPILCLCCEVKIDKKFLDFNEIVEYFNSITLEFLYIENQYKFYLKFFLDLS